jgi:putative PIN family toxin of toxin-antitoxin system
VSWVDAGVIAAVYDANVLLRGLSNRAGASGRCLQYVLAGEVHLVVSEYVLDELRRVSSYPKILRKFPELINRVPKLCDLLRERGLVVPQPPQRMAFERDPKDGPYIDLAIASGAMLVVSQDNDLLDLEDERSVVGQAIRREHAAFRVLAPPQFLAEIEDRG